jgi:hypothetical protein
LFYYLLHVINYRDMLLEGCWSAIGTNYKKTINK